MSSSIQYDLYDHEVSAAKGILHRGLGHENPVEGFKEDTFSKALFWILVIFSFGLFYLAYLFLKVYSPQWAAYIRYKPVSLDNADIVLVRDVVTNTYTSCEVNTVKIEEGGGEKNPAFSIGEDEEGSTNSSTVYINRAKETKQHKICEVTELKYLTFLYCRYIYSKPFNSFYPLTGLDGDNPLKRPEITLDGLMADDVLTLQKVYGPNEMKVKSDTYLEIFANHIVDPFYVFQLFTIAVWVWSGYYIYSAIAVVISVMIILIALRKKKKECEKQEKSLEVENYVTVIREGNEYYISCTELVPGDIVVLNKSSHYFTFDGIVLEGAVVVDNALLTGVTKPSYRYPDPNVSLQERLDKLTVTNHSNTIFAGTNMITPQCEGDVKALVVNTGFLTEKGFVVREECDNYVYSFDSDSMTYFKFLIVIGTIAFFVALLVLLWMPDIPLEGLEALKAALRLVTLAIPPSLPLALTTAFIWSMRRLNRELIVTRNFRRIPVAGRVNHVVFDKTGTLTKNKVEYIGHLAVYYEQEGIQLSGIDTSNDIAQGDVLYLMATCHSLNPKSIQSKEHTIDKEMFRMAEWDMVEAEDGTLKVYSGKLDNLGECKISLLKRFPFHSDKRTQSVIAEIEHENRVAYYVNGMPQRVIECCKPKTIPPFTLQRIQAFTKQGYIVTAMAYKNLKEDKGKFKDLKDLQKDLVFLGLLVFGDILADGAKEVIKSLNGAKFTTLMSTGDNLDTAVYTARQVGILPESEGVRVKDRVVEIKAKLDKHGGLIIEAHDYDDGSKFELSSAWGDYWDPPNYVINGQTFQILDDYGGTELDRVIQAGKVFAEMTPEKKKHLVELLRKMGHETCMVGDGSNDNAALQAADVGISLENTESGFAAPFYSIEKDVRSVPVLLNEGRTVHAQLLTIFMFTACYSILGMFAETLMYSLFYELSEAEWIYIDLILVMSIDLMLGYSESRETIATSRRSNQFFNSLRLLSMLCFLSVCIAVQITFLFFLLEVQPWYIHVETTISGLTEGSMETTYIFILIIFQMTFPAIVYTLDREPVYKNRFMMGLFAILYTVNTYFDIFPDKLLIKIFKFYVSPSMWFRVQVILIAAANLIVTIIVEIIFIINRPKN